MIKEPDALSSTGMSARPAYNANGRAYDLDGLARILSW